MHQLDNKSFQRWLGHIITSLFLYISRSALTARGILVGWRSSYYPNRLSSCRWSPYSSVREEVRGWWWENFSTEVGTDMSFGMMNTISVLTTGKKIGMPVSLGRGGVPCAGLDEKIFIVDDIYPGNKEHSASLNEVRKQLLKFYRRRAEIGSPLSQLRRRCWKIEESLAATGTGNECCLWYGG